MISFFSSFYHYGTTTTPPTTLTVGPEDGTRALIQITFPFFSLSSAYYMLYSLIYIIGPYLLFPFLSLLLFRLAPLSIPADKTKDEKKKDLSDIGLDRYEILFH